jgi:hypothetical protein
MTGTQLLLGIGSLFLMAVFAISIFFGGVAGLQAAFVALANLVAGESLSLDGLGLNVLCGFVAGLIVAAVRLHKPKQDGVVEELADTIADPTAVRAADISLACVGLHVFISVLIMVLLTLLGVHPSVEHLSDPVAWLVGLSPLTLAVGGAGDGGESPSPDSLWAALFAALLILICVVSILSGLLTGVAGSLIASDNVALPAVAGGAISGAQVGLGRTLGVGLVLVFTRLWTGEVIRRRLPPETPLTFDRLRETFGRDTSRANPFVRFETWSNEQGVPLTLENFGDQLARYEAELASRGSGRLPGVLTNASSDIRSEERRIERLKEPYLRFPEGIPELHRTNSAVTFSGWAGHAMKTSIVTSAIFGALYVSVTICIGMLVMMFE